MINRASRYVFVAGLFFSEQPSWESSAFLTTAVHRRKEGQRFSRHPPNESLHHQDDGTCNLFLSSQQYGNKNFNTDSSTTCLFLTSKHKRPKGKPKSKSFIANVTLVGIDTDTDSAATSTIGDGSPRRKKATSEDFEARRAAWEAKYGSSQALCQTFGGCNNRIWGDLKGEEARQLYHTLLPRSIVALQEAGILEAEELAPLAYQARLAAKEYSRMRSTLPNRLLAMAFDSYRSWRREGNPLKTKGMTWEDLWDKYEAQIVEEECESEIKQGKKCLLDRDALMQRIYLRILEKSCATNQAFDRMFLTKRNKTASSAPSFSFSDTAEMGELMDIASQLDTDVREILLRPDDRKKMAKIDIKIEKADAKAQRKAESKHSKVEKKETKQTRKELRREMKQAVKNLKEIKAGNVPPVTGQAHEVGSDLGEDIVDGDTKKAQYRVLRIAANARRKLRAL